MSYCVNCGVELDRSATKCALCQTPVYNPVENIDSNEPTPYSHSQTIPKDIKTRFVALIVTFIILIPNIVCTLVNLFFDPERLWFIYILSTSFLCWVMFIFPFLTKKRKPYLLWAFDTLAVAVYIFIFYVNTATDEKWFFNIALPSVAIVSACVLYFIRWIRQRKRHWTSKVLHIFVDLVISLSVISLCFFFSGRLIAGEILLIIDLCCLALVFFWLYANKSKKVRAWLAKKLFV